MNINLQDHGFPANLSIPITINIGGFQPQQPKETKLTSALAHFGTSLAAFLHSHHGEALESMIGIEAATCTAPFHHLPRSRIENAIKEIAEESATELAVELLPKLLAKLELDSLEDPAPQSKSTEPAAPPPAPLPKPDLSPSGEEIADNVISFVDTQLSSFYSTEDNKVQKVIAKGAELADDVAKKLQISPDLVPSLAQLGLYDMIVLCDDSGSMTSENRIPAAKDAILRLFRISTAFNPENNFSVVPFDNGSLEGLDRFKTEDDLRKKLDEIQFNTGLGVPGPLGLKVLDPLASKISKKEFDTPVIIVIITDGGASDEEAKHVIEAVQNFKSALESYEYTGPAAKMVLCRVGQDSYAQQFLELIDKSEDVKGMLTVHKEDLAEKMVNDEAKYNEMLIETLVEVISSDD